MIKLLGTDAVDLLILNRAPATKAAAIIRGAPLVIKNRDTYLKFMLAVTREAEDFRQTVKEYSDIYWRSSSVSEQDKKLLRERKTASAGNISRNCSSVRDIRLAKAIT